MLSHVQNQILTLLLRSDTLKYSEAHPPELDQDLYNYHLKFLLQKGYVEKIEKTYKLTDYGKKYVQQLDALGNFKQYFKFSVLPYVVNEKGEILMHKRGRHPYRGDVGSISGKVLYGETVENAATRKLKEETGLICENFKLIGVHRKIRKDSEDKLIEDTLYHCCVGENPTGELIQKNEFGENFWTSFDEAMEFQKQNMTVSLKTQEIYNRIQNKDYSLFYFQEEAILPKF